GPYRSRTATSRAARAAAPALLNPIRLITARLAGSRNSRGRGLPGWACQVTVPTSTKPKPSAGQAGNASPSLSIPAASPTGLGNPTPTPARAGPAPARRDSRAATPGGTRDSSRRVRSCATSGSPPSSRNSTGRSSRSYAGPAQSHAPRSRVPRSRPARPTAQSRAARARSAAPVTGRPDPLPPCPALADPARPGSSQPGPVGAQGGVQRLQRSHPDLAALQRLDALHAGGHRLHRGDARDAGADRGGADLVAVQPRAGVARSPGRGVEHQVHLAVADPLHHVPRLVRRELADHLRGHP